MITECWIIGGVCWLAGLFLGTLAMRWLVLAQFKRLRQEAREVKELLRGNAGRGDQLNRERSQAGVQRNDGRAGEARPICSEHQAMRDARNEEFGLKDAVREYEDKR